MRKPDATQCNNSSTLSPSDDSESTSEVILKPNNTRGMEYVHVHVHCTCTAQHVVVCAQVAINCLCIYHACWSDVFMQKTMCLSVFYALVVHALKMTNAHVTEYILLACVRLEIDMC